MAGLWVYTVRDINKELGLWHWLVILSAVFVMLSAIIYLVIRVFRHRNFFTTINGKDVIVKIWDLFEAEGWKLIPFNERFYTQVDAQIIAHDTLNAKMIERHVTDLSNLRNTIMEAQHGTSDLNGRKVNGRVIYPL